MANVLTSQIIDDGSRRTIYKFTGYCDTLETGVTKVDATSSGPLGVVVQGQIVYPGIHLKIVDLAYDCFGMGVRIQWHATSNVDAWIATGQGAGPFMFLDSRAGFQGLINPNTTGATGSIDFTTFSTGSGAFTFGTYSVLLSLVKGIPQT